MADLMELLQGQFGQMIVQGAASQLGGDESKVQSAVQAAIPMLMGALKKNAQDPDKAAGLFNALQSKHDGSIFDQLGDIFGGGFVNDDVVQDGEKILGHVFGEKKEVVAQAVSKKAGIDTSQALDILKMAAPVVMGMLGKQIRQNNVNDASGLGGILDNLLGQAPAKARQDQSLIEKLLDSDGDGSIIDDLFNIGRKFF